MILLWLFLGFVAFVVLILWAQKFDEKRGVGVNSGKPTKKQCPYCNSTDWQYLGQETIGARGEKTKVQYKVNLNPFRPFTLFERKEKVVRKANPGISFDTFICLYCGKRFR